MILIFSLHFTMKICQANQIAPYGTPHSARSRLGPYCLPVINRTPGLNEFKYCGLKN